MFTGLLTGVFKENAKGVSTRKRKLPKKEEFLFQAAENRDAELETTGSSVEGVGSFE